MIGQQTRENSRRVGDPFHLPSGRAFVRPFPGAAPAAAFDNGRRALLVASLLFLLLHLAQLLSLETLFLSLLPLLLVLQLECRQLLLVLSHQLTTQRFLLGDLRRDGKWKISEWQVTSKCKIVAKFKSWCLRFKEYYVIWDVKQYWKSISLILEGTLPISNRDISVSKMPSYVNFQPAVLSTR